MRIYVGDSSSIGNQQFVSLLTTSSIVDVAGTTQAVNKAEFFSGAGEL